MGDRDYFHAEFGGAPRGSFFAQYRGTKFLIIGLVACSVLMAILYQASYDAFVAVDSALALRPQDVVSGWIWQLITYAGLHKPVIMHLLWNCLYIWFFGRLVENRLTTKQYLAFCAGAVVLGGIAFVVVGVIAGSTTACIGASAACMALLVLAALWYPTMEVSIWGVIRVHLWVIAAVMVIIDLLNALYDSGGVAYTAHLGGAAYGWIYFKWGGRIEGVFSGIDAMAEKSAQKKERKSRARDSDLRKEIDRILDKVNREGMTALTDEERKFLKSASKKLG